MGVAYDIGEIHSRSAAAKVTYPMTMSAWCKPSTAATTYFCLTQADSSLANDYHQLLLHSSDAGRCSSRNGGSAANATTTNSWTAGVWNHICGVFRASDSRTCILNGDLGNDVTNGDNITAPSGDNTTINQRQDSSPDDSGAACAMAEVCIWNVELDLVNDVVALAAGVPAFRVRPDAIIDYLPMLTTGASLVDRFGGSVYSQTGTTVTDDHPPIIYMPTALIGIAPAAVVSGFIPYPRGHGEFGGIAGTMTGGLNT